MPHQRPKHQLHIIGGRLKRSKLPVLNQPGLRPTPQRVRETLFNWLGQDLTGKRCLDAFCGSGALAFESLSRGAAQVQMVDQQAAIVEQLRRMASTFKLDWADIRQGDGLTALKRAQAGSLDIIFLDPPFASQLFDAALQAASVAIAENGLVYLEAPKRYSDTQLKAVNLELYRYLKAGAVHAHLLRRSSSVAA